MTDRALIISADCHIDFPIARTKEFLESKYHEDFDGWFGMFAAAGELMASFENSFTDAAGRKAFHSPADVEVRLKGLDANGVAAEVLIPNFPIFPFYPIPGTRSLPGFDPAKFAAGCRAYNRWLAEFFDHDRQAALALITYEDVDAAVAEIRRAAQAGMRGVLLDGQYRGLPPLFDDYYEPIWSALEEEQLAATFHGGIGYDPEFIAFGGSPVATQMMLMEVNWFSHRPLWFLIYGGVLERHPNLRLVFTEQNSDWIPGTLDHMHDGWVRTAGAERHDINVLTNQHEVVLRSPREYWARQCYVGASLMSRAELEMRESIGVANMMYGTDFAHPEGTWNTTIDHLQALFGVGNVSEEDTRRILGQNAAEVYRFDVEKLAPVVDACGFTIEQILTPPTGEADPEVAETVGRVFKGW